MTGNVDSSSAVAGTLVRGLVLALLLLPGALPAATWVDDVGSHAPRVHLHFFWSESCVHCQRALPFVRRYAAATPWLVLHEGEIGPDPAATRRYVELAAELGVEARSVPAFIACGELRVGYDEDATTGRELAAWLAACRERAGLGLAVTPSGVAQEAGATISLPALGQLDPGTLSLPLLTLLLAGLDAFNPCAFFVLLLLLSLMVHAGNRARMLLVGGTFVLFSGLLYFLFMAAWLNLFLLVGTQVYVTAAAGTVALLIGGLNTRDALRSNAGATLAIPERAKPGLYRRVRGLVASGSTGPLLAGTVLLALAANSYELLCTAGFPMVYTRTLTLHALEPLAHYGYLLLYNVIYVLPLLAIVLLFGVTLGARRLGAGEGRSLKLLSGLMMLGLGGLLLAAPALLASPWSGAALVAAAGVLTWIARRRVHGLR